MICPKCGGIIHEDDMFDTCKWEDSYTEYYVGHCGKCKTEYQWEQKYKLVSAGINNFGEC